MLNRYYVISLFFVFTAILTLVMTPRHSIADKQASINLEEIIPKQFGNWKEVPQVQLQQIDLSPNRGDEISDLIYEQTLMRTYVNDKGQKIMLAIAYGERQRADLTVHRPEVCYISQGFQIISKKDDVLEFNEKPIPVARLVAKAGNRVEPITYWIRIGDELAKNSIDIKLGILKAGILGSIPDGLLFRVSMISGEEDYAFAIQDQFILRLLKTVSTDPLETLIGGLPSI